MAWLDLETEIAELFGDVRAVGLSVRVRGRARRSRATAAPSRLDRVLGAVARGARTPRDIARAASALAPGTPVDVADVRHDLQNLRRAGRVRRGEEGWTL